MSDTIVWIIVIGFFAPLHYVLPVLVLVVSAEQSEEERRRSIRRSLVDSTVSLVIAVPVAIWAAARERPLVAVGVLLLASAPPFVRWALGRR